MHEPETTEEILEDLGYEQRDFSMPAIAKWTVAFFAVMVVGMAISLLITWGLAANSQDARTRPISAMRQLPPAPRLQADPKLDYDTYMATEQKLVTSYGWIDRAAGTVRLPIDRAVDLVAERGLPTFAPAAPGAKK